MKKVIGSLLLSLFVVVFLPSCGGGDSGSTGGGGTTTPPATNTGNTNTGNTNTGNSDSGSTKPKLPDGYKVANDGTVLYNDGKPIDLSNIPEDLKDYYAARNEQDGTPKGSSDGSNVPDK